MNGADAPSPDLSYVLPIRQARFNPAVAADLRAYLLSLRTVCSDLLVIDGSAPEVFAEHARAWGDIARHLPPDARYRYLNGKVNGLFTGVDHATGDSIVVGDDDVRYQPAELRRIAGLLTEHDYVKPQNYFRPLPLYARIESARMLVNRAVVRTGDYPGTCGFRRSTLRRIGPYDGDVLFENEEMFRHFALHGARICCADDLFVQKRPPGWAKFLEQRPRQSYEDLVMRGKTALFASFLPLGILAWAWSRAAAGTYVLAWFAGAVALAERGRRRAGGTACFSWDIPLFAVPWVLERGVSVYVALFWRLAFGGLPYWGRIVPKGTGASFTAGGRAAIAGTARSTPTRAA